MELSNEYDPIGCEHKLSNGLTAWQFQSEEQNNLNGGLNKVAIYVCINCGEISVGGYRTGADGSHNSFDEHFNIHCPDAIDAIIKQANFFNEEAKWCRADDYALAGGEGEKEAPTQGPDYGICQRCKQERATAQYSDLYVCEHCDKMLNNEFDEEYR